MAFFIAAVAVGITERSREFPKSKLAMMSTFDTLQMLLSMLAQPHVSGKMQVRSLYSENSEAIVRCHVKPSHHAKHPRQHNSAQ